MLNICSNALAQNMIPGPVKGGIFIPLTIVGLVGNLSVVLVIAAKRRLHTMHFFLLANLSLADFLLHIFSIFNITSYISEKWIFGLPWCEGTSFLIRSLATVTTLLLCAVTWECHSAVVTPFQFSSDITVKKVAIAVLLWIVTFLFSVVSLLSSANFFYNNHLYVCEFEFKSIIMSITTIVFFIIPLGLIAKQQYQINKVAKHQKSQITQQQDAINSNSVEVQSQRRFMNNVKESKDALLIVTAFLMSYLPAFVIGGLRTKLPESDALYTAWSLALGLTHMGSTWNPVIYCLRKRLFRRQYLQFIGVKRSKRIFPQVNPQT